MTPFIYSQPPPGGAEANYTEAFWLALLLTGSVAYAEAAVVEAIRLYNPNDAAEGSLLSRTIEESLRYGDLDDDRPAAPLLREELRPLLRLTRRRRQCFVLKMLANRSNRECAGLLGLSETEVERYTREAMVDIATARRCSDRSSDQLVVRRTF